MLSHSKIPKSFWGEPMRTSIDLINLSPSVPLKGDVPERVWTWKDVSYDHLRMFGCKTFVHIPKDSVSLSFSQCPTFSFTTLFYRFP